MFALAQWEGSQRQCMCVYMYVCVYIYIYKRNGIFFQRKLDCKGLWHKEDLLNSAQAKCDALWSFSWHTFQWCQCINTAVLARWHVTWDGILVNFCLHNIIHTYQLPTDPWEGRIWVCWRNFRTIPGSILFLCVSKQGIMNNELY